MKKKTPVKGFWVGLALLVATTLFACAPKAAPAPAVTTAPLATPASVTTPGPSSAKTALEQEWQGVLAAARKEGTLNFYTTFAPPELRAAMARTMQDSYAIKMEWLVAPGATNAERIRVEQKAKQYVADLWWTGFSVLLTRELRATNGLMPFTPPIVAQEPNVWKGKGIDSITDERDALTITQRSTLFFVVNSNLVRLEDYPKSYKDVLNPRWKGKIVMHDPTVPGGGTYVFGIVKKEYGLEYWEKMKEQNLAFIRDYGEVGRRVSVGEALVALGLGVSHTMPFLVAGAPIKMIAPVEGIYRSNGPMYLINHAPHPNAGKVFINWALSKEGQEMISRLAGDEPIRTDVEYKTHPEVERVLRSVTKEVVGDWKFVEESDADVSAGTARKVFGLK